MRTIAADQRSAFPHRAGVPSWGAVLIALTGTLVGLAIDAASGDGELGAPFATFFALGCIVAVLAVRQSGIFTAVVQPPLLLFVAVPLAYFLFHSSAFGGLKDIAISCGYPLIERFPLMLFTSAAVLLIGMTRWFLVMSPASQTGDIEDDPAPVTVRPRLFAGLGAALSAAFARSGAGESEQSSRPRHGTGRQSATRRPRPERRPEEPARTRRPRPPLEDVDAPPRRRQPAGRPARAAQPPLDPPPRRPRAVRDPGRTPPPPRRETRERRDDREQYPPRPTRSGRYEPYEAERGYSSRETYPPYEPRGRPAPGPSTGTHHPVSRVRYRDSAPADVDDLHSYRNRSGR
jgi:hypothetical protein